MNGFFSYDGFLVRILTKVMYVVSLNLMFLICSIPIFTIGAANTAMYTVLQRYHQGEEPPIIKGFFRAFRDNFKSATLVWLVMLALGGTLGLNYILLYQSRFPGADLVRVVLNLVLIVLLVLWIYIFPAIAHFENSLKGYVVFSVGLAVARLPYTVVLVFIQTVPLLGMLFLAQFIPSAVLLLLCCGASLPAYFSAKLLLSLFKYYEDEQV